MNRPVSLPQSQSASVLPSEFEALCPLPQLLPRREHRPLSCGPGRNFRRHQSQSAIEWLLAIDIAELSWEMQRYRVLRHRLLSTYRQKAVEMTLRRIDVAGIAPDAELALAPAHHRAAYVQTGVVPWDDVYPPAIYGPQLRSVEEVAAIKAQARPVSQRWWGYWYVR